MKMKIRDIKEIIKATPKELKGVQISTIKEREQIGYAMRSCANWAYQVWAVLHDGRIYKVVSVFGEIK